MDQNDRVGMSRDRIKEKFQVIADEHRPGLIMFLTAGFPDVAATLELVPALVEAGADAIELVAKIIAGVR